jgi:Domain of unknown function (DUF3846)
MSKAMIVKADPSTKGYIQIIDFNEDESYATINEAVGGRFDCVSIHSLEIDMWINDEGKILGLEINPFATALWVHEYGMTDMIMGDVIITGGPDSDGYARGIDTEKIIEIMNSAQAVMDKALENK